MASTRKSRSLNKRFSKVHDESPDKDGGNGSKSKQRKRKLSDMLGSQWSKEELERFYEAYRKYGKDWKKVAVAVRNRSVEMVEALYNMNRAYLSLPEGTASVVGLIAMMTDHYSIMESESERESNDEPETSRKPQKRARGKLRSNVSKGSDENIPDLLRSQSVASNYGCLSLLKKKRSGGSRPRAVGKRTPRFPVSYSYDKYESQKFVSPNKQVRKSEVDTNDDEVAVLVLAEALQKGGSPHVSQTPKRTKQLMRSSPVVNRGRMHADSEGASAKVYGVTTDEDGFEGSLGSREAENGDFARDTSYMMDTEGVGTVEVKQKGKRSHGKKSKIQTAENDASDDIREACSGTEEGLTVSSIKEKVEDEVTNRRSERHSPHGPRKRSRQLFFGDESSALDALCTLADLSMKLAPTSTIESESSVQFKEEKTTSNVVEKSSRPEAMSGNHQRGKAKMSGDKGHKSPAGVDNSAHKNIQRKEDSGFDLSAVSEANGRPFLSTMQIKKRKRKSLVAKTQKIDAYSETRLGEAHKTEDPSEEEKKSISKIKRIGQIATVQKQAKSLKPPERSSSNTNSLRLGTSSAVSNVQVSSANQVSLPTKLRSRRKKALMRFELKSPENIGNDRPNNFSQSLHNRTLDLKEKLSRCLSSQILRRWCAFEWFYSAIDYPWFAKREFVEYLNHVGLGHIPRLTRVEWGVIRSSLGKPRRLSQQFLHEEKEKLEQYRESVRTHYTDLRSSKKDGLPADLAQPPIVGNRVIAWHPKTRELHDGKVLTVYRNKCRVQFDRPELGSELVMDIDCMPLNPLDYMPEALRRQSLASDKLHENFSEHKLNGRSNDWKSGGHVKLPPSENQENADGTFHISPPAYPMNTLLKHAKGDTINSISQAKAAASEIVNAQKSTYTQPCTLAQIQAREADIRALSDLTRALDKKEALVLELRHMNDEVLANQKDGDSALKDSEPFKKQYATVLIQLKEANDQVSSALLYLRQRNTYQGNSPTPWLKPQANSGVPVGSLSSYEQAAFLPQESGSRVVEILETSRLKAQTMVDAAVQVVSSLKVGEDAFTRVGEALDSADNRHFGTDSGISAGRSFTSSDPGLGNLANHESTNSCTLESVMPTSANGPNPTNTSEQSVAVQIPSELISSCVATLLVIQTCTERQYPPAEVAQILDSAVTSLQPYCSQNTSVYREIQMCMGLVKNQILALIPT